MKRLFSTLLAFVALCSQFANDVDGLSQFGPTCMTAGVVVEIGEVWTW